MTEMKIIEIVNPLYLEKVIFSVGLLVFFEKDLFYAPSLLPSVTINVIGFNIFVSFLTEDKSVWSNHCQINNLNLCQMSLKQMLHELVTDHLLFHHQLPVLSLRNSLPLCLLYQSVMVC